MKLINSMGPNVVFFTSRAQPIKRLAEVTEDEQFGWWGANPTEAFDLKVQIMGRRGSVHVVGNGHFSQLFQQNPQLKLFVTYDNVSGVEAIERTGGGLKLKLETH
jgi:hypothetical protein